MNRSDFLMSLGISAAGLILPPGIVEEKPIKIYDNYVKGVHVYQKHYNRKALKEGEPILLKREGGNEHDSFAISVWLGTVQIGFIAAFENIVLANLIDQGVKLFSFISYAKVDKHDDFEIGIEVYAHLVLPDTKIIESTLTHKRADDLDDLYRKHFPT